MTQKAATTAMKMSVVWTMGSGMPIVARRSGGLRGGLRWRRGGAAASGLAGAAVAQRCETSNLLQVSVGRHSGGCTIIEPPALLINKWLLKQGSELLGSADWLPLVCGMAKEEISPNRADCCSLSSLDATLPRLIGLHG